MIHYSAADLKEMDRVKRLNLINGITGIKPANLIGTKANDGQENVAIFSSILHLGSNPALLGFMVRPVGEVPRNTYENILENGFYTINHINTAFLKQAHYTSVKFDRSVSEFEACKLTPEYIEDFHAPYVQESHIKIGMKYLQSIPIERNGTTMVIGEIQAINIVDNALEENGYVDLEAADTAGISGLNSYYKLAKVDSFPYARLNEVPTFD